MELTRLSLTFNSKGERWKQMRSYLTFNVDSTIDSDGRGAPYAKSLISFFLFNDIGTGKSFSATGYIDKGRKEGWCPR